MNKPKMATEKGNSRVLMLLGQLERMNGEAMVKDVDTARQVTAKILHLIQTQEIQGLLSFESLAALPSTQC
ncbi:hypothetical protein INR49_015551 [Caranx melampygus]|nr:hypothetical protein INR49_015551 [Caranx melampygus]